MERELEDVSAASLARFARRAQKLAGVRGEVNILISGNRRLQALNRTFRRKNCPTDVLSFSGHDQRGGDIAISAEIACMNAVRYRHSPAEELRILILHGMLHLAGYDHENDGGSMAKLESRLRFKLRLPTALIQRASANGKQRPILKKRSQNSRAKAPGRSR